MFPRTRPEASARPRAVAWFSRLAAVAVAALIGGLVTPLPASAAVPAESEQIRPLQVAVTDTDLLAGSSAGVTISVANPGTSGAVDLYNATGIAILPPGVAYVPGSSPLGEPVIRPWIPDPSDLTVTGSVLIWENVADLVRGTELELPFRVTATDASHPVGSTFRIGGAVYASSDERELPLIAVPPVGPPTVTAPPGAQGTITGGAAEQTTRVTPLVLQKSVSEAEDEVYRGSGREHTFTVTVTNAPAAPTERVEVVDLLPATFRLVDCATCTSAEVVEIEGQVFTRLVWSLGTVTGGSTAALEYTVRIDATEQTLPEAVTPGAPTRPGAQGSAVTNTATATGHYTGAVAEPSDTDVRSSVDKTVTVLDLGVVKSTDTTRFAVNGTAVFTLHVRGSSLTDAGTVTLTDVIPDGMCPLVPAGVTVTGARWPDGCPTPGSGATAGSVTGATMTAVDARADGSFVVSFAVAPIPGTDAGAREVTYATHLRADYAGGSQTSSGDSFTNVVTVAGAVAPADGNDVDDGERASDNGSQHGVDTERVSITKEVWQNPQRAPITGVASCPTVDGSWSSTPETVARFGDLVCFRVSAALPSGVPVRDALLTDFLPRGTELVAAAAGPHSTVAFTRVSGRGTAWHVGEKVGDHYYAAAGGRMELILVLRVVSAPPTQPQVTGNLAKLRYVSATGEVFTARAAADFTLAPPVPLALTKTATPTNVQEGQNVDYVVSIANRGDAESSTDHDVDLIEVWDALPAGFTCDAIVAGSVVPASQDCGVATSSASGYDGRSIIRWVLPASDRGGLLAPGASTQVRYRLMMPSPLRIGTQHRNDAAVTRYTVPTTDGTLTPPGASVLIPTSPLGPVSGTPNAPEASDSSTVRVADAVVAKSATTELDVAGNGGSQATVGEAVTYTYSVRLPARTTVYSGRLVDTLPSHLARTADATMTVSTGVSFTRADAGCSLNTVVTGIVLCADGTVLFPETWTNTSTSDAVFTVTLPTRVTGVVGTTPSHGQVLTNTAVFSAKATAEAATRTPVARATADITVVLPTAAVDKSVLAPSGGAAVEAGATVTFRLLASNPTAGRPPLYGWTVTDCAPQELVLTGATVSRGTFARDASVSCDAGHLGYRWSGDGQPLLANAPATADVTFHVPADAPAGYEYVNVARIAGQSHPTETVARPIAAGPDDARVRVARPIVTKTVDKATAVEGERLTWTISARILANTTVHGAALVDTIGNQLGAAADVQWGTPVCSGADTAWVDACGTLFQHRTDTVAGVSPQKTGQYLGDLPASSVDRVVTVTLSALVPVTTATTARTVRNDVDLVWFFTPQQGAAALPVNPDARATANATTTVLHPAVTLAKTSTTATPQPGQEFGYTVTASVASGATARTAYGVTVVDHVPAGIIVRAVDNGGVFDAGARTITWNLAQIAPGASVPLRYTAVLDDSTRLDGTKLRNVADATWKSLPGVDTRTYTGATAQRDVTPAFPKVNATKSVTAPSSQQVLLGQNASYQILLTNVGGADARQVDAVDVLPQGWRYQPGSARVTVPGVAAVAAEPTLSVTDGVQTLSWQNLLPEGRALGSNQSVVITLDAHPTTAEALGGIGLAFAQRNTARATRVVDGAGATNNATGSDSYLGTTGSASAKVAQADLKVTKVGGDIVAGRTATWTVTVTNRGPDPASGVAVRDTFSATPGMRLTGASGAGWSCTAPASEALTCTRTNANDTLASGSSWTITVSAAVDADAAAGTAVTNVASVTSSTYDPDPKNDSSTASGTITTQADLEMVKTAASASVVAGEQLGWTLAVRNLGPSVSRVDGSSRIEIHDTLPASVTDAEIVSTSDGAVCTLVDRDLACTIDEDMVVGAVHTVSLRATVAAGTPASTSGQSSTYLNNTATVTPGLTSDPAPKNDSGSSSTRVTTFDRLSIGKILVRAVDEDAEVIPGETFTYEVTVTGQGPSSSRGITVTDRLPNDTTLVGIDSSTPAWRHTGTSGQSVTFAYDGILAPGESAVLRYEVLLGASVTGTIVNSARATSTSGTPTDPVEAPSGTQPKADLGVVWSERRTPVVPGGAGVPLQATVTNYGPSAAHDGRVTFRFPADVSILSAPDGCEAEIVPGAPIVLICELSNGSGQPLQTDDSVTFEFLVGVGPAQVSSPTVSALTSMSAQDVRPSNNTDVTVLDPTPFATIDLRKSASVDTVDAGRSVIWTITATSAGPSDARSVHVTDTLPAGLAIVGTPTWQRPGQRPASCEIVSDRGFDCAVGTLPVGVAATITVETVLASSIPLGTVLENTATVSSTTPDLHTGVPVRGTATGRVESTVDSAVRIDKRAQTDAVVAGTTATFTLDVRNDGISDAAAPITVTDFLPEGMTFAGTTSGGAVRWACEPVGTEVTCTLVDREGAPVSLAAGASAPQLTVTATASSALGAGTVTNRATVTSSTDPGDDDTADVEIVTNADLRLRKTHAEGESVLAGTPFTWTFTVANEGPSDSVATADSPIVVRDVLPAGVTLAGDADPLCADAGDEDGRQVVECRIIRTIPVDDEAVVHLRVSTAPEVAGVLINRASVSPGLTPLPDDEPREDEDRVPVVQEADLTLEKTGDLPAAIAGVPFSWTLRVMNHGPSVSSGTAEKPIVVRDVLPAGVSYVSGSGDGWTCRAAGQSHGRDVVECARTDALSLGAAPEIHLTGRPGAGLTGTLVNNASVIPGQTPQPVDGRPDQTSSTTPITPQADLSVVKSLVGELVAGRDARYRLTIHNAGPSDAVGVTVVDLMPRGLRALSAWTVDAADCSVGTGVGVTCAIVRISAGVTMTVDIDVRVAPDVTGTVTNTAMLGTGTPDPDPTNNTSTVTDPVRTIADLSIVKSHEGSLPAGGSFVWTLAVTNHGPSVSAASGEAPITVVDHLPVGVTFASAAPDVCTAGAVTATGQDVTCHLTSGLGVGATDEIRLTVNAVSTLHGTVRNTASVTPGLTPLPDTSPREAFDDVDVVEEADLSVRKTPLADSVTAGTSMQWRIDVTNHGPADSEASADNPILVTDTLPAGVSFVSATGEGWTCTPGDPVGGRTPVRCERAESLDVGGAAPITITGAIGSGVRGEITNDVTVAPGLTVQPEGEGEPDMHSTTTPVTAVADLALIKSISRAIVAGAQGEYTLSVTNIGPSDAEDVVLVDDLPAGLHYVGAPGGAATCAAEGQTVTCALTGPLVAGTTAEVRLTVDADADLDGDITNTASVSTSTPDPNPDNDGDEVTGTIVTFADVSLHKSVTGDAVVGGEVVYTLQVSNAGPSQSRGLVVVDELPVGLTDATFAAEGWECTLSGENVLTCLRDVLEPGAEAPPITVTATVTPAAYPELSNTATVSPATPQQDPEDTEGTDPTIDDSSTATVTIPPASELTVQKELVGALVAGSPAQYRIVVDNVGLTEDPGPIRVEDQLPTGLSLRAATVERGDGACQATGDRAMCELVHLAAGDRAIVLVDVHVEARASGTIVNVATVRSEASTGGEPVTSSASGDVHVPPALSITGSRGADGLLLALLLGIAGTLLVLYRRRTAA